MKAQIFFSTVFNYKSRIVKEKPFSVTAQTLAFTKQCGCVPTAALHTHINQNQNQGSGSTEQEQRKENPPVEHQLWDIVRPSGGGGLIGMGGMGIWGGIWGAPGGSGGTGIPSCGWCMDSCGRRGPTPLIRGGGRFTPAGGGGPLDRIAFSILK